MEKDMGNEMETGVIQGFIVGYKRILVISTPTKRALRGSRDSQRVHGFGAGVVPKIHYHPCFQFQVPATMWSQMTFYAWCHLRPHHKPSILDYLEDQGDLATMLIPPLRQITNHDPCYYHT